MSRYIKAFAVPKGNHTRIIRQLQSYHAHFWYTYENERELKTPEVVFRKEDNDIARIVSVPRYLELCQKYRDEEDVDLVDDMSTWLQDSIREGADFSDTEIVLVMEL